MVLGKDFAHTYPVRNQESPDHIKVRLQISLLILSEFKQLN